MPLSVHMGNGKAIKAMGTGMALLHTNSTEPLYLTAMLLVPDIRHNLILVNWLDEAYRIIFSNGQCHISEKNSQAIVEANSKNGLY